jgi:flagellar basal-body rod protein FlgF
MVNKTLLPPGGDPAKPLSHSEIDIFKTGTAFALLSVNRGLGEPLRFARSATGLGGPRGGSSRGEPSMQNALLIGLSRQTVLERQLDVVANNIANVNTAGFKADQSLFEEYLTSGAHEDNFVGRDRRVSYVQDRGTYRDQTQGALEQTKNPLDIAISGSGYLAVQTAGGERYTRDGGLHLNNTGQLVTAAGDAVLGTSGPIVFQPTDHDINVAPDGTITVLEGTATTDALRGKLRVVSFADAQSLLKQGSNLYSAGAGAAQADTRSQVQQGFIEKSNVNSVAEMSRMIEVTRAYTQISTMLQQESDLHKTAIEKLAEVPA